MASPMATSRPTSAASSGSRRVSSSGVYQASGRRASAPPGAAAETELAPFYADGADARAFTNTLIALTIEEPPVTAADVDGWSERTRAIARVASADVSGCLPTYQRLAGSRRSGDERLLEAKRMHDDEIRKQLAAATAALRDNVVRVHVCSLPVSGSPDLPPGCRCGWAWLSGIVAQPMPTSDTDSVRVGDA